MSASTPPPNSGEQFLADLMLRLEGASQSDRDEIIQEAVAQRPDLESSMRHLACFRCELDGAVGNVDEPGVPERLGDLRIIRRIGCGGMGEIYLAEQESLKDRKVAVKVIRHGRVSEMMKARFLREQEVLAELHQTNIVPIHLVGELNDLQYFVMPYIDGAALHHVVQSAYQHTTKRGSAPTLRELAAGLADSGELAHRPAQNDSKIPTQSYGNPAAQGGSSTMIAIPIDEKLTLPMSYYRSVARTMAEAAEAIHYAHKAGILHRDVKPSNVMVDREGQCWVIDFGLAGYLRDTERAAGQQGRTDPGAEPLSTTGFLGTMHYSSPEQLQGKATDRSDTWSLGATLYELCTLRRPFDGDDLQEQIASKEPTNPRTLVTNLPVDLVAICCKAMNKSPSGRYESALEMSEDLHCWLHHQPTIARPARVPRRVALWAKRNPGWAVTVLTSLILILSVSGFWVRAERIRGDEEEKHAKSEQRRAEEEKKRADDSERGRLMQEIIRLRLTKEKSGWFPEVWERVRAVSRIQTGSDLRDEAAATLNGWDAKKFKTLRKVGSSLLYNPSGRYLLIGGTDEEPAYLWDSKTDEYLSSRLKGSGPVAFDAGKEPTQLVAQSPTTFLLWSVANQKLVHRFSVVLPDEAKEENSRLLTTQLAPDGSYAAVAVDFGGGKASVTLWDVKAQKVTRTIPIRPTSLALSSKAELLAIGTKNGDINVWDVAQGKPVARLPGRGRSVTSLAFGPNGHRSHLQKSEPGNGWLLASGDEGGLITIWDLQRGIPCSFCRGSYH